MLYKKYKLIIYLLLLFIDLGIPSPKFLKLIIDTP